ncbi:Rrf2 family transcriptional regulator [Biformimicrobium ophioploci]|uniref:Fe-S cluster assembly transcriptional regulator IscR n=1 Tax=Biformimicrobium ophioploci TaxID=3036711 RepID=A0ABQ6LZ71_9GAMM|nr:Rrf2 family transcriptional regulator [Microbulbifer sp. NKW57]GMG87385.1 Fe-S cluster assembly transcriptional regulator IscR [Microbulbifer sp. NKW57]
MRLTTKGRYAVTAMLDLALHGEKGPISLSDIAQRQDISLSYLEQLFSKLRQAELVSSVRGPGGGYRLARGSDDIHVAEIIDAVNESVDATNCGRGSGCASGEKCLTHHLWSDLSDQIHVFLSGISLSGLVARADVQQVAQRQHEKELAAQDIEQKIEIIGGP